MAALERYAWAPNDSLNDGAGRFSRRLWGRRQVRSAIGVAALARGAAVEID